MVLGTPSPELTRLHHCTTVAKEGLCHCHTCSHSPCSYRLVSFEAVTRRTDGNAANGFAASTVDVGLSSTPIIIGEPDAPSGVAFSSTSAGAAAADIVIHLAKPIADVASGYYLTLKYYNEAGTTSDLVKLKTGGSSDFQFSRTDPSLAGVGGTLEASTTWKITIDKDDIYCGAATTDTCGGGKYTLDSFGAYSYFDVAGAAFVADPAANFAAVKQVGAILGDPRPATFYGELGQG